MLNPGELYARVAYFVKKQEGYINNLAGGNLQGTDTRALRSSLHWQGRQSELDIIANYQQDKPPGTAFKSQFFSGEERYDDSSANLDSGLGIDREILSLTALLNRQLNAQWRFSSASSYRQFDNLERFDADGFELPILLFDSRSEGEQFNQSLRFYRETQSRFSGFVGVDAFWKRGYHQLTAQLNEQYLVHFPVVISALTGSPVDIRPPPVFDSAGYANPDLRFNRAAKEQQTDRGETLSIDLLADGQWQLSDHWGLNAGLRLIQEKQHSALMTPTAFSPVVTLLPGSFKGNFLYTPGASSAALDNRSESAIWSVSADYQFGEGSLTYWRYARGRRPEILDFNRNSRTSHLQAETVDTLEWGLKWRSAQQDLSLNSAVFYQDYRHFLTLESGLNGRADDNGQAQVSGIELTGSATLTPYLSTMFNLAYVHARLDDETHFRYAGNHFRLSPDWTGAISLHAQHALADWGVLFATVTSSVQSEMYFDDANHYRQSGYGLSHLRVGVQHQAWELALQVNNLFDRKYLLDVGNTGADFGIATFVPGAPRVYSLSLSGRY
ncbi:MAG: hypothetical protein JKY66_08075 [Spongiibacteraceae bacterium]|nr:hypothetical protein [Spongiibacteraceae bacterium]